MLIMTEERNAFQTQVVALRRTQILDAATKVFAEQGYHRTTIREVAKAAGVADGTIYNYFENKSALLLGILDRLNETEARPAALAQATGMDLRAFFLHYLRHRLALFDQQTLELYQVLLSEVLVNPELRRRYVEQIVAPTFALAEQRFSQLIPQGKQGPLDIALVLRIISGSFLGLLMLRVMEDPEVQTKWDDLPELLTTMLFDGLLPDSPLPKAATDSPLPKAAEQKEKD
jgi:AcrR family transcriptional regulator